MRIIVLGLAFLSLIGKPRAMASQEVDTLDVSRFRATVNTYCITCHNSFLDNLPTFDTADLAHAESNPALWEKVIRKLRTGAMPPPNSPQPAPVDSNALVVYLQTVLDRHAIGKPNPGRPVLRRLTRTEYVNAVRDLFGIQVDGEDILPPEFLRAGFDNNGEAMSISSMLTERYLLAARKISRRVVDKIDGGLCGPQNAIGDSMEPCAMKLLAPLVRLAYRGAVTPEDLKSLRRVYLMGERNGGFKAGMQFALQRILIGPKFLFRIERAPNNVARGAAYRISTLELATRLSFFLWSSIPDDELLRSAESGRLEQPEELERQMKRLWEDSRSQAIITGFFGQWLQLDMYHRRIPSRKVFPDFDDELRNALATETRLFLEHLVRENRPLSEMLDADYTFANERLARHYGIPKAPGGEFHKVTLSASNRRGLLGHGSILSMTSEDDRTSIVRRGVWLMSNLLGAAPQAPPANVPMLEHDPTSGRGSMERHRSNPKCASCHAGIDPLGISLENFDAIGRWRTTEGPKRKAIDSSARLPNGYLIEGPAGLRKLLVDHRDQFITVAVERLLAYALGREVEYSDQPFIRRIKREAAPDYRWLSLLNGVITSVPFQTNVAQSN